MKPIFFCLLTFLATNCKSFEPLTLPKQEFTRDNLKLDGYYYIFKDEKVGYGYDTKQYDVFILFQNGVYYNAVSGGYDPNLSKVENQKKLDYEVNEKVIRQKDYVKTQIGWGVFNVQGSEIKTECWTSGSGGTYPTQMIMGEIINDSTIRFTKRKGGYMGGFGKRKKTFEMDETYHFRQFSPKPDSANIYIK